MPERLLAFFLFLRRASSDQVFQFPIQTCAVGVGQIQKAERLQASLRGPHRKQHVRAAADAGAAEVEQNCHSDAFVERVFERDQPAVDGQLIHATADLTPVFEQHQSKDGTAELDARAPVSLLGNGRHSASIVPQ